MSEKRPPTFEHGMSYKPLHILLRDKVREIFPQGSQTPPDFVLAKMKELLTEAKLNIHSLEDRDDLKAALINLVPEGKNAETLRGYISKWRTEENFDFLRKSNK